MNFPEPLTQAIRDYWVLLRKGYPEKRTLELVADRYHLDRSGRAVLFRGVFMEEQNSKRKMKAMTGALPENAHVMVDALNQLYCIASYLSGHLVFIASDGFLRDASGFHGEPLQSGILERSVHTLCAFFGRRQALSAAFLLDTQADAFTPVQDAIAMELAGLTDRLKLIESDKVDAALSTAKNCILATSDSTVIERTACPVFDLARHVLEAGFSAKIPEIDDILAQIH